MITVLMLLLLAGPYVVLTVAGRISNRARIDPSLRGRIGLALLFTFTGIGHFAMSDSLLEMLPAAMPQRLAIIYVTGVLELVAAVGVLDPKLYRTFGLGLIVFLVLSLPANVFAALHRVGPGGHVDGPVYLAVRVPLQLAMIGWTYWFAVRRAGGAR